MSKEKTPTQKAEVFLSEAEKMLAVVKFIEDPSSVNRFPEVIEKLRSEHEALMSRDPRSLPLAREFYQGILCAKEFVFKVFSSSPERESWKLSEIINIADFFDVPKMGELKHGYWELVDQGLIELLPDYSIKPVDRKTAE